MQILSPLFCVCVHACLCFLTNIRGPVINQKCRYIANFPIRLAFKHSLLHFCWKFQPTSNAMWGQFMVSFTWWRLFRAAAIHTALIKARVTSDRSPCFLDQASANMDSSGIFSKFNYHISNNINHFMDNFCEKAGRKMRIEAVKWPKIM